MEGIAVDWSALTEKQKHDLWERVGCTYEGCATGDDPWIAIQGEQGTPGEGQLAVLCETHFKAMATDEDEDFLAKIGHVVVSWKDGEFVIERFFKVHFGGEALEDWRKNFPDMPPGDEVVLQARLGPCSVCGNEIPRDEIAGFDPEVLENGIVYGKCFCSTCMEEGH